MNNADKQKNILAAKIVKFNLNSNTVFMKRSEKPERNDLRRLIFGR